MRILHVADPEWEKVLAPVAYVLDQCRWWIGGAGAVAPREFLTRTDSGARPGLESWHREYGSFVEDHPDLGRICQPGYFSRYASALDRDWAIYFASDAPDPVPAFREMQPCTRNWFEPFPHVPREIVLIGRVIDGGYWDFFFRDDWMFDAVAAPLRARGRPRRDKWQEVTDEQLLQNAREMQQLMQDRRRGSRPQR